MHQINCRESLDGNAEGELTCIYTATALCWVHSLLWSLLNDSGSSHWLDQRDKSLSPTKSIYISFITLTEINVLYFIYSKEGLDLLSVIVTNIS